MAFLSELIGRPVTDADGVRVGKLKDVVAEAAPEMHHPVVKAIVVQQAGEEIMTPYTNLAVLLAPAIPLNRRVSEAETYTPKEDDIFLARDVLDKQIIDTDGARVIRVNDLELLRVNGKVVVSNVDVGGLGILRRIGLGRAAKGLSARLHVKPPETYIAWDHVELLRYDQSMRLKAPREMLAELHPADIAEIISDLNRMEGGHILDALNVEQLADTLEEVEPDFQADLVEDMPDEKVADLLEEMEPDEAADLLAELPPDRSQGLLALMEKREADDVRKLLSYPDDSAGGIMTTEYAVVPPTLTAAQTIEVLRQTAEEAETIFYIYVVDDMNRLVGVSSLKALIFAPPDTLVSDFMVKRLVTVNLLDSQDEVAQVISKYDLLAVPVVDDDNVLQGIVTADDALDKIIPTAWKKRLPRFFR